MFTGKQVTLSTVTGIWYTYRIYCSPTLGITWKTLGYVEEFVSTLYLGGLFMGIFVFAYLLLPANKSRISTDRIIYSRSAQHALEMM